MMRKLNVQLFIEQHSDWEKILSEKPYCLNISRDKWNGLNLLMLKYDQIESDFNQIICRECRGLILNEDTNEVVSYPFQKFGNVQEGSWVEKIDWNDHPYVLEKCDGSLIKVVKINGKLLISTNGTIQAANANIAEFIGFEPKTFEDLFYWALKKQFIAFEQGWFENLFEEGFTYMFELCTNYNRVVVPHPEPKVYFIGIRDNVTYEESYIMDHPLSRIFLTPKVYKFGSFDECINTAKALPWDSEGYVITSRDFKRNKAKSLEYLAVHHLHNNGVMSYERAIVLVKMNEVDEVLSYFPEFKDALLDVKSKYNILKSDLEASHENLNAALPDLPTRKDQAIWIQKNFRIPGVGFAILDNKVKSTKEWVESCPEKNLVKYLGYKD